MKTRTIWAVVALVASYVLFQAVADVGATKLIEIAGITMPAGTFVFAITFTLRDMLHKRLGKQWAQAAIVVAGLLNIVQAAYLAIMARVPAPVYYANAEGWNAIFAVVPAIALGSIIAEMVSELIDTEIYSFWKNRFGHLPQWTRVLVSNVISLPIDSLIFATMAFVVLPPLFGAEAVPFFVALSLTGGQIVFKGIVTLVSLPGIYLVKEKPLIE